MLRWIRRQSGQVLPIAAALVVVLFGVAGLAIDGGHVYLSRQQAQNAADLAALASGRQLAFGGVPLTGPPSGSDASVRAAHDFAANNGIPTTYQHGCDTGGSNSPSFSTSWVDTGACGASSGFNYKVSVSAPANPPSGVPMPSQCSGSTQYHCLQVTVQMKITNFFMGVLGVPYSYTSATAVVYANPPFTVYPTPPPVSAYLYEPQSGCAAGSQCFTEGTAPARAKLSCTNCPTVLVNTGTSPQFNGIDGNFLPSGADTVGFQSNGDIIIRDKTTFCDPYKGATCTKNSAVGSLGFALAGGSKLYCTAAVGVVTSPPCTTTFSGLTLNTVAGNETGFSSMSWTPNVTVSGPNCGALVLNGNTVKQGGASDACYNSNDPYVIQPGVYQYIIINHGSYSFESGLYDITGIAPDASISHGNESAASDFDLCAGVASGSCTAKAGVWIGHGTNAYGPYVPPSAGGACNGGGSAGGGGGGDATVISGFGVTFRFESASAGFVSTHEAITGISSPGLGSAPWANGVPLLFDMENNGFIHLDGTNNASGQSGFSGLVYQTTSATAGGVEINPGLAGASNAALGGQVFAYSLATFGTAGRAIDFTQGYGGGTVPGIITSGKAENAIMTGSSFKDNGDGTVTFQVNYFDEWALDAYDVYVKVNAGNAVFFSQGVWSPTPAAGAPLPPPGNTPSDASPTYPPTTAPGGYTQQTDPITGGNTDWTLNISGTGGNSKFEIYGMWTWGHEADIPTNNGWNFNQAVIKYTFPKPSGTHVLITIFMTDGDHCGDYTIANQTYTNPAGGGSGVGTNGGVSLVL